MKKILVLVDFSDASTNALSFAAELAKRAAARLLVMNIIQKGEDEDQSKKMLRSLESKLKKTFGPDLKCDSDLAKGNLITTLKKIITVQEPDLLVMGTKGASGLKKILIGSNTVNVIAKIKIPVLVIPEEARFKNFYKKGKNRIVMATDLELLENDNAIGILKEIAMLIIEPKVRILSVRPKNTVLPDINRLERNFLISVFKPEIEPERVTVFSKNVISGLNFYLNKNKDTGLIAMIARDTGKLIQKHFTREMASQTQLPLLVLHDVKI